MFWNVNLLFGINLGNVETWGWRWNDHIWTKRYEILSISLSIVVINGILWKMPSTHQCQLNRNPIFHFEISICKIIRRILVNLVYILAQNDGRIEDRGKKIGQKCCCTCQLWLFYKNTQWMLVFVVSVSDFYCWIFTLTFQNGFTFNVWNWMFLFSGVSIQLSNIYSIQ